ncbi:MAG: hypothetical protein ACI867_000151 [Glaciecola sp.]|jgi:hypothetical protein
MADSLSPCDPGEHDIAGSQNLITPPTTPSCSSLTHLLGRLGVVEARLDSAIAQRHEREESDQGMGDLVLSDAAVTRALDGAELASPTTDGDALARLTAVEQAANEAQADGEKLRLRDLIRSAGLTAMDVELLLCALAPSVDERFGLMYAYLHGDNLRTQPTVAMALRICGASPVSMTTQGRLSPKAPLCRSGLVELQNPNRPLVSQTMHVPRRVVEHLLGGDELPASLAAVAVDPVPTSSATSTRIHQALTSGESTVYVQDDVGAGGGSAAAAAYAALDVPTLMLDLTTLPASTDLLSLAEQAQREACLTGAGIVVEPLETLARAGAWAVRAFADLTCRVTLVGRQDWDPAWSPRPVPIVTAERVDAQVLHQHWGRALGEVDAATQAAVSDAASFHLTPRQITSAARAAVQQAAVAGRAVTPLDVQRGIRGQNAAGLERLARRIEPKVSWSDLVLPARIEAQLRSLPMRWRHRDKVLEDWGMGRGVAHGRGVSALFAGGSGTGKTLSAEVLAADLGLDLYVVDLSTVIDKYIGETSKNLERIFDEADRVNGVLLFDEADALFGKRSAVTDSKDRHANTEVAFLLQRIERFDGVAILTTNLASNLDEAFLRRLDAVVDFPDPSVEQRQAMWATKLAKGIPAGHDVDTQRLSELFTLSGAEIANVIVSGAYQAADRDGTVTMLDLVHAAVGEHRKIGRHLTPGDLAEYAWVLDTP